jgi:O-acetyl-ADP-ribose deacetylase (regulator of RNase III)
MTVTEERKDLFTVGEEYYLAHCIAADLRMGAGIAVPICQKFSVRTRIRASGESLDYPTCILTPPVFSLITKKISSAKPTYGALGEALLKMKAIALEKDIRKIAMPKIGCGLDRLQWGVVRPMIERVFEDTDVEILVCIWK